MATTYTWASASNTSWSTTTDWNKSTGGNGEPGSVSTDIVLINVASSAVTFDQAGGWNIGSLTIGSAGSAISDSLAIGANSLTSAGVVSLVGKTSGPTVGSSTITLAGGSLTASSYTISLWGTISGYGTLAGVVTANPADTGTVLASGGILELTSNIAALDKVNFKIDSVAGSELKLDGSAASGTYAFTGASGTLAIAAPASFSGTVSGLIADGVLNSHSATGVIDLTSVGTSGITSASITGGNTLRIVTGSGTYNILTNGSFTGDYVNYASDGSTGELVWVDSIGVCYNIGTHILTEQGEIAVEAITAGDLVMTLREGQHVLQPVKWVGFRHLDLTRHPHPETAAPVRVLRNAFGFNLPHRDLVVSPDHSLFIDGQLIPAKLLINGSTIVRESSAKSATYYHIELDRHEILLAEGLPAESYLDTGNRAFFANGGQALVLHPEFEVNANLRCWQEDACAPLAVSQDVVGPVWHRLVERAATLGYDAPVLETTDDADVHLLADGLAIRPLTMNGGQYTFMLPAGVTELSLVSRANRPVELRPYHDDPRKLGVSVNRLQIRDGAAVHDIPLDHPALSDGWHCVEQADGRMWRWTDGRGAIPIAATDKPLIIELNINPMVAYLTPDSLVPVSLAA